MTLRTIIKIFWISSSRRRLFSLVPTFGKLLSCMDETKSMPRQTTQWHTWVKWLPELSYVMSMPTMSPWGLQGFSCKYQVLSCMSKFLKSWWHYCPTVSKVISDMFKTVLRLAKYFITIKWIYISTSIICSSHLIASPSLMRSLLHSSENWVKTLNIHELFNIPVV